MKRDTSLFRSVNETLATFAIGCGTIGLGLLSVGCQTPSGSVSKPLLHPAATPVAASLQHQSQPAPMQAAIGDTSGVSNTGIAQVGFTDRLRAGACPDQSCGACQSCAPAVAMPYAQGYIADSQEWLCNGGDQPPKAVLQVNDRVVGTQPQDAIVHYTTEQGDIKIAASNPVCLYSPRFGSVRQVSGAVAGEKSIGLANASRPVGPGGFGYSQPSLAINDVAGLGHANVSKRVDAMRDRNRGVPVESIVGPVFFEDVWQILATLDRVSLVQLDESQIAVLKKGAVAAQSWMVRDAVEVMIESVKPPTLIRDAAVEGFVEYDFPDAGRLQIVKVADRDHAVQGETVQFAIHLRNVGDSPVDHVEVVDNLVARLEYIAESQKADREATFESTFNGVGSSRLMWTLAEPLKVGEAVTIEFSCKVR